MIKPPCDIRIMEMDSNIILQFRKIFLKLKKEFDALLISYIISLFIFIF